MAGTNASRGPHPKIVVGLPDIQDQIRLIHRLCATSSEPELRRWEDLGNLLYELYAQLQHKKQVTIFRFGSKSACSSDASRRPISRPPSKKKQRRG
ncbi:MAG: hypothetical protein WCU88_00690 [Elusimicrobiota bacterium]